MNRNSLLKLAAFIFSCVFLAGCETCPNSVQYGEIGIKISPMACVTKSTKEESPKEKTTEKSEKIED